MYNTVMLIGRITAEPELTKQDDKKEVCKGDLISVRGQLRTSTFTVNDEKKYSTEVVVDKIAFLANKSKDSEETKDDGE